MLGGLWDLMTQGWQLVTLAPSLISGTVSGWRGELMQLIYWFFNPAGLFDFASSVMGQLFGWLATMVDEPVKSQLVNMGAFLDSAPFVHMFKVGLWLASPIFDPTVTRICAGAVVDVWLLSVVVKGFTYLIPLGK